MFELADFQQGKIESVLLFSGERSFLISLLARIDREFLFTDYEDNRDLIDAFIDNLITKISSESPE